MDALDRLYLRLVERLRRERHGSAGEPLTVADVYQHLVPYRTTRAELGFAELPEYEHALLRLLSGERGYAALEDPRVEEELRRELRAPNPILGLYRDYAETGVRVILDAARPELSAPPPPPAQVREPPRPEPAPAPPLPPEPPPPMPCRVCAAPLPAGREVRYCPSCGAVQRPIPCRACGELVDPEWKFCIGCGVPQHAAGSV